MTTFDNEKKQEWKQNIRSKKHSKNTTQIKINHFQKILIN